MQDLRYLVCGKKNSTTDQIKVIGQQVKLVSLGNGIINSNVGKHKIFKGINQSAEHKQNISFI